MSNFRDDLFPAGWVTEADAARFAGYREATAFFEGAQWQERRMPGEHRLTFNYARTLIRKVASYVFPGPVSFTVASEGDDHAANRAESLLAGVIAANDLAQLDVDLCVDASVRGDAAIKVTWDIAAARPAVVAVDPSTLLVWTVPGQPRQVERIAHGYWLTGAAVANLFGDPSLEPRQHFPVVEEWSQQEWRVSIAGQLAKQEANPYGWIPYIVLPNNPHPYGYWGSSDLIDLYDTCRELNSRMSVLSQVLELSGAPIAVLENVSTSDGIRVRPGARWELPEGARAYLLDLLSGGGAGLHVQYIDLLYRSLHDLAETPRTAFGDSGRTLSGAALEVEIQPLVQKVGRKRRAWDAFYRQRNERLLDLAERFGGAEIGGLRNTATIWPGVLPGDVDGAVRNAVALVGAGIQSRHTAAAELGNADPEAEMQRVADEREVRRP